MNFTCDYCGKEYEDEITVRIVDIDGLEVCEDCYFNDPDLDNKED